MFKKESNKSQNTETFRANGENAGSRSHRFNSVVAVSRACVCVGVRVVICYFLVSGARNMCAQV